jgi:hypothetical protein
MFVRSNAILGIALLAGCTGAPETLPDNRASIERPDVEIPVAGVDSDSSLQGGEMKISQIYLVGSEGRLALLDEPTTVDLIEFSSGAQTVLAGIDVPAGHYSSLQVLVESAIIDVETDGAESTFATDEGDRDADGILSMPSWEESGFKAILPPGGLTISGTQRFLVVTLDLAESFGRDVQGTWIMVPVFRALEVGMTSDLVVNVWAAEGDLSDFTVVVWDADRNMERSAVLEANGDSTWVAHFQYLDPSQGPFAVELTSPANVTFTTTLVGPFAVFPESGETDTLAIRVIEVTR